MQVVLVRLGRRPEQRGFRLGRREYDEAGDAVGFRQPSFQCRRCTMSHSARDTLPVSNVDVHF